MKSVEFKSFDKVLVRNSKTEEWKCRLLDRMFCGKFLCQDGLVYKYCLPYNGNTEYLVGKSEFYEKKIGCEASSWKPKDGDFVYIKDRFTSYRYIFIKKVFDGCSLTSNYTMYDIDNDGVAMVLNPCSMDDHIEEIRLATESEKQLIISKLKERGKKWNPKKKCIEDIWTPKDGDFVTYTFTFNQTNNNTYKIIMVCKLLDESTAFNYISYNSYDKSVMSYKSPMNQRLCKVNDLKPATEEEKQLLLDKSREAGLDWDAEKKEVAIYRWRPKKGEKYYYVNAVGWIGCFSWGESMMDNDFLEINNCF